MSQTIARSVALAVVPAALLLGCFANPIGALPGQAQGGRPEAAQDASSAPASRAAVPGAGAARGSLAQVPAAATPTGPAAAPGEITRTELFEDVVTIEGVRYRMLTVELVFGPNAETPVHVHPGPSSGYLEQGRITVKLDGRNTTNTYTAGSAVAHPWDQPHIFRNTSGETTRMISFELIPMR
jgi:quercetin dioxygenase-like cupin family protein